MASMRAVVAEAGKLVVVTRSVPVPAGGEVLVKIHSTAINRADTLQRKGQYAVPEGVTDILGLEMSGEVVSDGAKWKQGDKVMGLLSGGGYAEYTAVDERLLMKVPQDMGLREAAGIPETWLTAYQLLHLVGEVKKGEKVVVHAAGSGVGTSATQLAVDFGCKVVATAGTNEKLEQARRLGAAEGINYKECEWAEKVQGADVVLDPVGGSYTQGNLKALGLDGRWVLYGLMGGASVGEGPVLGQLLRKRISVRATTLRTRPLEYRAGLVAAFTESELPKFDTRHYAPIIDSKSFTLDTIQDAHDYMETNTNIGKILVAVA